MSEQTDRIYEVLLRKQYDNEIEAHEARMRNLNFEFEVLQDIRSAWRRNSAHATETQSTDNEAWPPEVARSHEVVQESNRWDAMLGLQVYTAECECGHVSKGSTIQALADEVNRHES